MQKTGKGAEIEIITQWLKQAKKQFPQNKGWKIMSSESYAGNIVGTKGYPDFMIFNKKTKELVFIELKAKTHGYHSFQKQTIKVLMTARKKKAKLITFDWNEKKKKYSKLHEEDALKVEPDGNYERAENIGFL
ncbi:MAG: GxxExxY protein [Candidatus ainarchaeum sp.]|nr:GxxExxY protein [Candidatus ainarchaeum sp.]